MVLVLAALVAAGLALAAAGWVILRHWKEIRLLDPLTVKEERQRQQRASLIHNRFHRLRADHWQPIRQAGRHLRSSTAQTYRKIYARLQAFENLYKNLKSPFASMAPSQRERMKTLLSEARSLMRDHKWSDAERRLLEVLALDPRHADAYKGLGQIYLKQKLYPQAKETLDFLVKIKKTDDGVYAALAEIAAAEGNVTEAEALRQKAAEASPRQPLRHAELAEFYLSQHQTAKAWTAIQRAVELDPKSSRYLETSLEVAILLGDRTEGQKRLHRLRLISDDRAKLQTWQRRVEEMTGAIK